MPPPMTTRQQPGPPAVRAGMLPMITARTRGGGFMSSRSHQTTVSERHNPHGHERFTKLKGVIVNNLLKAYHKKMHRQHDDEVYKRAVEEVDRILNHGKLTERDLQQLQRKFASDMHALHQEREAANAANRPGGQDKGGGGQAQGGGAVVAPAPSGGGHGGGGMDAQPTFRSTKKPRKNVDEWSVLTLYNDVVHFEEQKVVKKKELEDKAKTRQMLLDQMEERKRVKEGIKQQEKEAARDQQRKYEEWKRERDRQDELRIQKIMRDRNAEAQVMHQVQQRKKEQAERVLQEEQRLLQEFAKQISDEKEHKEREMERKAIAYQKVLVENEKDLERKRQLKEKERAEDERLFKLQIEMADKQERMRAEREAERQAKLKAAERMAGDLGNRAAELEAQVEARVRQAQENYRIEEEARDRNKREKKQKDDKETHQVLQQQIKMHEDYKQERKREERLLADRFRREAEAFKMQQANERVAKRQAELKHRAMLDQQLLQREQRNADEGAMSEIELRLNANILRKVVDADSATQGGRVPEAIKDKVAHAEKLKEETPRRAG